MKTMLLLLLFLSAPPLWAGSPLYVDGSLPTSCSGATYSIANRDCTGTDGRGYRTGQAAVMVAVPGDTILMRGGVYPDGITISKNNSGRPDAYKTIKAFPGERVIHRTKILVQNSSFWQLGDLDGNGMTWTNPAALSAIAIHAQATNNATGGNHACQGETNVAQCAVRLYGLTVEDWGRVNETSQYSTNVVQVEGTTGTKVGINVGTDLQKNTILKVGAGISVRGTTRAAIIKYNLVDLKNGKFHTRSTAGFNVAFGIHCANDSYGHTITHNTILNINHPFAQHERGAWSDAANGQGCRNSEIAFNYIEGVGSDGAGPDVAGGRAIHIESQGALGPFTGMYVHDNVIKNSAEGIKTASGGSCPTDLRLEDNTVSGSFLYDLWLPCTNSGTVRRNKLLTPGKAVGIRVGGSESSLPLRWEDQVFPDGPGKHFFVATSESMVSTAKANATFDAFVRVVKKADQSADDVGRQGSSPPPNIPPVATFLCSPLSPVAGETVTCISSSTDADGTLTHAWDFDNDGQFDDGGGETGQKIFSEVGTYLVRLQVTDDDGARAVALQDVVVVSPPPPPNMPPVASFIVIPVAPVAGEMLALMSIATDPDGQVVLHEWAVGEGSDFMGGACRTDVRTFVVAGEYAIGLRVTDEKGAQSIMWRSITIGVAP